MAPGRELLHTFEGTDGKASLRRLASGCLALLATGALVFGSSSAGSPSDAPRADGTAGVTTKIPCYRRYHLATIGLRRKPRRCLQFIRNEPNHANEVSLRRIRWTGWGRRIAKGTGVWVYFATGGIESRTRVRLRARRRVAACGVRFYSRLRVTWNNRGTRKRVALRLVGPPRGCP
jgi:hypothetical protein